MHQPSRLTTTTRGLLPSPKSTRSSSRSPRPRSNPYSALVHELKSHYHISIRKWRRHMSGVAYELLYPDGTIKRLIATPRPRSPVSAAIFLHEVGHHAVGFQRYSPRCLEEYYVWQWALRQMAARHIPITPRVLRHYHRSMHHYLRHAQKHHPQQIPPNLHHLLHHPI